MCHPGYADTELAAAGGRLQAAERETEVQALTSPEIASLAAAEGISLVSYQALGESKLQGSGSKIKRRCSMRKGYGMPEKFDAIVIGSGQGGNPLVHKLADLGWTVALIERDKLGGTCINTGCSPTKTMVASAQVAHYARQAARWGVRTGAVSVDMPAVIARKNKVVEAARGGQERAVAARKSLRLVRASARFTGPHTIEAGGESLTSEKIFINTGQRPLIPAIEGLEQSGYLTNATIMELDLPYPEHLIVLGGGYVGVEFGQMFARFGSRVTIVHDGPQIVAHEDPEISAELQKILEAEGLRFVMQAETRRVQRESGQLTLTVATAQGEQAHHLRLASLSSSPPAANPTPTTWASIAPASKPIPAATSA